MAITMARTRRRREVVHSFQRDTLSLGTFLTTLGSFLISAHLHLYLLTLGASLVLRPQATLAHRSHPHPHPHPHFSQLDLVPCEDVFRNSVHKLPCLCSRDHGNGTTINCDFIAFFGEFPALPFRQPIRTYSQRYAGIQGLEAQLFTASNIPLQRVDFSHNLLRRLMERLFDGIESTLQELDISHNLLGDQLNPIFSTNELLHLKALQLLDLSYNQLRALDSNLFRGLRNLTILNLEGNEFTLIPVASISSLKTLRTLNFGSNQFREMASNWFPTSLTSLQSLNLTDNRLTSIKPGCFGVLAGLQELLLGHNKLRDLSPNSFDGLKSLEVLDLTNNFLDYVPTEAIANLRRLKRLSLGSNMIQTLEENGFAVSDLPLLEHLDLSRNALANVLGANVFTGLSQLKTLNLAYNSLKKLDEADDTIFLPLVKLEVIDLTDNQMVNFPTNALHPLATLRKVFLDYNMISTLSEDILSTVTQADELSLAYNLVQDIPVGTFRKHANLRLLNLHGNKIDQISQDTFDGIAGNLLGLDIGFNDLLEMPKLDLPKLMILNVAMNQFTHIGADADLFEGLPSLRHFNLSFNQISHLPSALFKHNKLLEVIDLQGNLIDRVDRGVFIHANYTQIILSGNRIKELSHSAFEDLYRLQVLDLSHNEISSIKNGAFDELQFLKKLKLNGNRLTSFKGDFFTTRTRVEEIELRDNLISYLYPNSFVIHRRLRVVDLGHNKLSYFPSEILNSIRSLERIDLSFNKLQALDNSDFANMPTLKVLDLRGNEITFVSGNTFHNSTSLNWLDLSRNRIQTLEDITFKGIARLNLDISFNNISSLHSELFNRQYVYQLESLNLARNNLIQFPSSSLKKQYSFLEKANLSHNSIEHLPTNSDVLVNIKDLDLSFNPLSSDSLNILFTEPKSVRRLHVASTAITSLPATVEAPFLRHLNLSANNLTKIKASSFERTSLLKVLDLSGNKISNLNANLNGVWNRLEELRSLYLSQNPIQYIMSSDLRPLPNLEVLDLSLLPSLTHLECDSLSGLSQLKVLLLYGYPSLNYLEIQECLAQVHNKLEQLGVEMKENYLQGHLQRAFSPRIKQLLITGTKLRSLSSSSLSGIKSPKLTIQLMETSVSSIPSTIFGALPMSTKVDLFLESNEITNLDTNLIQSLDNKQMVGIKLMGLESNPIACDCHSDSLWKWINQRMRLNPNVKYYNSIDSVQNLTCNSPTHLYGHRLADLELDQLECVGDQSKASSTSPTLSSVTSSSTTTKRTTTAHKYRIEHNEVLFEPLTTKRPIASVAGPRGVQRATDRRSSLTKVDTMVIGIVAGVIAFVSILILIICVVRLRSSFSSHYSGAPLTGGPMATRGHHHQGGGCTCLKPVHNSCNTCPYPPQTPAPPPPPGSYSHTGGTLRPPPALSYYGNTLRPVPMKVVPIGGPGGGGTISGRMGAKNGGPPSGYYMTYSDNDNENHR